MGVGGDSFPLRGPGATREAAGRPALTWLGLSIRGVGPIDMPGTFGDAGTFRALAGSERRCGRWLS